MRVNAVRVRYGYTDDPQEIEEWVDQLARKHAETDDEEVKKELEELSQRVADMRKRLA